MTKEGLRQYITEITSGARVSKQTQRPYADQTKRDIRLIVKKFFRWLRNDEFVSWIRLGDVKPTVRPEEVLQEVELNMVRGACKNLRNKALIETLYEGAFRPHEFLGLKKSDIVFDEWGAVAHVARGKTGARRARLVNAAPLLANWIENHPMKGTLLSQ